MVDACFDVVVVGGGHAGCEAALAAARSGARTCLVTQSIDGIGQMSCNPAIGGIGKSHLVHEVDALGGAMGQAIDAAGIHFRVLNARKGPAVRALRAQADRGLYRRAMRQLVDEQDRLHVFQQMVGDLWMDGSRCAGVVTVTGWVLKAPAVVLTVGTFLGGTIHLGDHRHGGGRAGDPASRALAERLRATELVVARLKTGTPPRVDARTVDMSALTVQPSEDHDRFFSCLSKQHPEQIACYTTQTHPAIHDMIRESLHRSAMYAGHIEGVGPRYCPSIEDKVVRFAERDQHTIFVEPEGLTVNELYLNGLSTSLPQDVQQAMVRLLPGFEHAHVTRPGYAIEYDYFDPQGLEPTLASRVVPGLWMAGQINGTTGYEEAAAQGLLAGANAAAAALERPPWVLRRDEAYLGVLVDDLVTRGTQEPYRMFTSRAEHRLLLREDNADKRLTEQGRARGLVDDARWAAWEAKREGVATLQRWLATTTLRPDASGHWQGQGGTVALSQPMPAEQVLTRHDVSLSLLDPPQPKALNDRTWREVCEHVATNVRYHGYIERQEAALARQRVWETAHLPVPFAYETVQGLSNEAVEVLNRVQPVSLGQASRLAGITPAAIQCLMVHAKKAGWSGEAE